MYMNFPFKFFDTLSHLRKRNMSFFLVIEEENENVPHSKPTFVLILKFSYQLLLLAKYAEDGVLDWRCHPHNCNTEVNWRFLWHSHPFSLAVSHGPSMTHHCWIFLSNQHADSLSFLPFLCLKREQKHCWLCLIWLPWLSWVQLQSWYSDLLCSESTWLK